MDDEEWAPRSTRNWHRYAERRKWAEQLDNTDPEKVVKLLRAQTWVFASLFDRMNELEQALGRQTEQLQELIRLHSCKCESSMTRNELIEAMDEANKPAWERRQEAEMRSLSYRDPDSD